MGLTHELKDDPKCSNNPSQWTTRLIKEKVIESDSNINVAIQKAFAGIEISACLIAEVYNKSGGCWWINLTDDVFLLC